MPYLFASLHHWKAFAKKCGLQTQTVDVMLKSMRNIRALLKQGVDLTGEGLMEEMKAEEAAAEGAPEEKK